MLDPNLEKILETNTENNGWINKEKVAEQAASYLDFIHENDRKRFFAEYNSFMMYVRDKMNRSK